MTRRIPPRGRSGQVVRLLVGWGWRPGRAGSRDARAWDAPAHADGLPGLPLPGDRHAGGVGVADLRAARAGAARAAGTAGPAGVSRSGAADVPPVRCRLRPFTVPLTVPPPGAAAYGPPLTVLLAVRRTRAPLTVPPTACRHSRCRGSFPGAALPGSRDPPQIPGGLRPVAGEGGRRCAATGRDGVHRERWTRPHHGTAAKLHPDRAAPRGSPCLLSRHRIRRRRRRRFGPGRRREWRRR